MDKFPSNRGRMYDRCHKGRGALKESCYHNDGGVRCPCSKCDCTKILKERVVKVHLYKHGFKPNYWIWTDHSERMPEGHFDNDDNCMGFGRDGVHRKSRDDQFMSMQDMVHDALNQREPFQRSNSDNMEEAPNEETQRFYNLLLDANKPLYEGASDSKLSMCVRLLASKSNWNVPDQCLEFISKMLLDVTPIKTGFPKSYYDAKKLVSKLGLEVRRIDCCEDGCMLFYDN